MIPLPVVDLWRNGSKTLCAFSPSACPPPSQLHNMFSLLLLLCALDYFWQSSSSTTPARKKSFSPSLRISKNTSSLKTVAVLVDLFIFSPQKFPSWYDRKWEVMAMTVSVLYLFDYVECCGDPNCLCSEAKGRLSLSPPLSLSLSYTHARTHTLSLLSLQRSQCLTHSHTRTHTHTLLSAPEKKNPFMIYYSSLATPPPPPPQPPPLGTLRMGSLQQGIYFKWIYFITNTTNTSLPTPCPIKVGIPVCCNRKYLYIFKILNLKNYMEILNAEGAMGVNYHDGQGQLPFTQVFPL